MEKTAARLAVQHLMALSIRPEPEVVDSTITLLVWKTFCSLVPVSYTHLDVYKRQKWKIG